MESQSSELLEGDKSSNIQTTSIEIGIENNEACSEDVLNEGLTFPKMKKVLMPTHFSENSIIEGELDFEDEPIDLKTDLPKENSGEFAHTLGSLKKESTEEEKDKICNVTDLEEGEVDDNAMTPTQQEDDLEEGEVKDNSPVGKQQVKQVCRYFNIGKCTWGNVCRFLHLSTNDRGNYNMFSSNVETVIPQNFPETINASDHGPMLQRGGYMNSEYNSSALTQNEGLVPNDIPPIESAWERGLRHAREVMVKANQRREQEPDFEEKRLNLSLEESSRTTTLDYDKENDIYGKTSFQKPTDNYFFRYEDYPNVYEAETYDIKNKWQAKKFENFEIRWTKPGGHKPEFKEKLKNKEPEHDRRSRNLPANCWQDERLFEIQSSRTRADEWRDPWRRSKTPKGRRSRSKKRSHHSYSSVSSRSFSGRSCHSSYSSSRSSSRSSYYSSRRSSSRSPSKSHSHSYSRSLSMDSVSSVSSSISHSSRIYNDNDVSPNKGNIKIESSATSKSFEKLLPESGVQDFDKKLSKSKDEASTYIPFHSSVTSKNNISHTKIETTLVKEEPLNSSPQTTSRDQPKLDSDDGFIELKLGNKEYVNAYKKATELKASKTLEKGNAVKSGYKRSASPVNKNPTFKRSKNSRREELLKQLKAVEEAIARKRSKLPDFL